MSRAVLHASTIVDRLISRQLAAVVAALLGLCLLPAGVHAASSNSIELHPVSGFVRDGCGGTGGKRGVARTWLFELGSTSKAGPAGVVAICSARRRTSAIGVVAGLTPSTPYHLVVARSRRDLRRGCGRQLQRVTSDAAGVARIRAAMALRWRPGAGTATVLALVADTEESNEIDEQAECGVEEPLSGASPGDPATDPGKP